MSIKNKKDLIGNIVIIVSIIIVIITIFMCVTTHESNSHSDSLNWNDMHFILIQGVTCNEKTNDTIKFSGGYGRHDIEVKKGDASRYNQYIGDTNSSNHIKNGFIKTSFNDTHDMEFIKIDDCYHAFVFPKNPNGETGKKLDGNITVYEFTCPDREFLMSFTHSITHADPNDDGGVKFVT